MTVNDILEKIKQINRLYASHGSTKFNDADIDEAMELLMEYKEELLRKKVVE